MATQLTGELIRSAVASKIAQLKPGVPIYKELQDQGTTTPFFFVTQVNVAQSPELNDVFRLAYTMSIRFEPPRMAKNKRELCSQAGIDLTMGLEYIEAGRPLRGRNMAFEIVDEVLVFNVTYTAIFKPGEVEGPKMEDLAIHQEIELNGGL